MPKPGGMEPTPETKLRSIPASKARELLEEQRNSGLTIAKFARSKGVHPWTLYNAQASERRRFAKQRQPTLTEVRVVDALPSGSEHGAKIELALPSGIAIRVARDFDEVALRRLLGVLSAC